jgi:hypothetical protein
MRRTAGACNSLNSKIVAPINVTDSLPVLCSQNAPSQLPPFDDSTHALSGTTFSEFKVADVQEAVRN